MNRPSSASAFVIRQQTKQGRWLRLRVTLTSYNTSSGRLVLCLNQVLDYDPADHYHPHSTPTSTSTRVLSDQHHGQFSESTATPRTTHCEQVLLPNKLESSIAIELHTRRSASQPSETSALDDMPDMKMTLSRCWATDVQLAWAAGFDPDTDRACSWHMNGKRPHSHVANEWSKPYGQRQAADDFISYQQVNNCSQLQQLLNCDSSYMITQSIQVTNQPGYVDLAGMNTVYDN